MLTRDGDVKVMDFGIARAVADASAHHDPDRAGHRHRPVLVARAGSRRAGRRPQRPLLDRLPAVRAADRQAAFHRRLAGGDRLPARQGRPGAAVAGGPRGAGAGPMRSCSRPCRRTRPTGTSRPARCATTSSARCPARRSPRRCWPQTYGAGTRRMGAPPPRRRGRTAAIPPYRLRALGWRAWRPDSPAQGLAVGCPRHDRRGAGRGHLRDQVHRRRQPAASRCPSLVAAGQRRPRASSRSSG